MLEILARSKAVESQCNLLLAHDYISQAPEILAKTVSRICSFLSRASVSIYENVDWDDPDQVEQDTSHLRLADDLIQQLASHLRYVEGARTDRLPWGIIEPFIALVGQLFPRISVLLRPKWHYNYSLILHDLRSAYIIALEEFQDFLPNVNIESDVLRDFEKPFHIIAFPSLERENILLHSLLGHEIGHLFVEKFMTDERKARFKAKVVANVDRHVRDQLQSSGISEATPLFMPQLQQQMTASQVDLAASYWSRASEEIISDIVGALLFGPASVFSTLEMAMQQGYDIPPSEQNNFYPPWRRRLREVFRIIDEENFSRFLIVSFL